MQNRFTIALAAGAVALFTASAFAQDQTDTWRSIENIHGDADGFFIVSAAVQDALMFDDPTLIADYAFYPLTVNADGERYDVLEPQDLLDDFDQLFWPETRDAVLNDDVQDYIVTSEGVGLGNGAMWITNVCLDEACEETQWGIITINN